LEKNNIVIGTRGSKLALWQANWVKGELEKKYPDKEVSLLRIKTLGDKITDVPLSQVGGKGLFVKEIEEALLDGRADIAVHSMKDVPTDLPDGLHLAAIAKREDPRDALISSGVLLKDLRKGAKVGTSSLRRGAQLLSLRPDLEIAQLRGNLDTRLRKLDEGLYDAIILAGAGVRRLGWEARITELLSPEISLPAIGQGAIGIESRVDDDETNGLIAFFDHRETSLAVRAERGLLTRLEGGCQVPIAAYGTIEAGGLEIMLTGLVAAIDGKTIIKDSMKGPAVEPESLGTRLAESLLGQGAWDILKDLYDLKPPEDPS